MTDADFAAWAAQWRTAPEPIVPVPALEVAALRGCRVIIGLPGHGWRGDMRADNIIMQGAQSMVPVLAEGRWYRAESDQVEVLAALVPAERVWVETVGGVHSPPADPAMSLVTLDAPPIRLPRAAADVPYLTGRRIIATGADHVERDLRAVTEPYAPEPGTIEVRVMREADWYRWAISGQQPPTRSIDISQLWVE